MKKRLDQLLSERGLAPSRNQAAELIKDGLVKVDQKVVHKSSIMVDEDVILDVAKSERYVSRAGQKLASVAIALDLDFQNKIVLDVGSSTGGFTDFALKRGAKKVYAVDVGTDQLDPGLRGDPRVISMEQTDIRDVTALPDLADIAVIDVSFISIRKVIPATARLLKKGGSIVAMVKPQFEASDRHKHKGVIKNDRMRRDILKDFEESVRGSFLIEGKADSGLAGKTGNVERFYLLRKSPQ